MLRRDLLKALAATPLLLSAADPNKPLFFTQDEYALLDHITEMIIPTDDHSPGAHQAGVAKYIDFITAQSIDPETKSSWRKGLQHVNQLSTKMSGRPFLKASAAQQTEVLTKLMNDHDPFFGELRDSTASAYYTTSIGIHTDMQYKGNVLLDEFVGYAP